MKWIRKNIKYILLGILAIAERRTDDVEMTITWSVDEMGIRQVRRVSK